MIEMRKPKKNNLLTECFQKTSLNSKTRAPQAIEHKPKIDEVHLNPADMNDYYDIAGDNHCFVSTITHYDKPLTMRLSAIKDNQNLEPALEKRGFKTNSISGRVTLRDFKQNVSSVLQKIDSNNVTSFLLSISCHGQDDELLFSDNSRFAYCSRFH